MSDVSWSNLVVMEWYLGRKIGDHQWFNELSVRRGSWFVCVYFTRAGKRLRMDLEIPIGHVPDSEIEAIVDLGIENNDSGVELGGPEPEDSKSSYDAIILRKGDWTSPTAKSTI